ncbi:MAG: glycine cleavage system aminomethyltransferase GcvT [Casimicrobiaceae bacterium]
MLNTTTLNAAHRALGARMVDFGGWDMPVNYGSQIDEHRAVRTGAGMFDVSHMRVVDVTGSDARAFLRYALANNVDKLRVAGKALYSCLLRDDGGVLDDLIVYFLREDFFRLVVNAGTADDDIAWLHALARRQTATVTLASRTDLALLAVQGPDARAKFLQVLPAAAVATAGLAPFNAVSVTHGGVEYFIARTGYTGEDGFEIAVPAVAVQGLWNALREHGVKPCGLGARDTLRLEAGMNLYGHEMDAGVSPLEAGLAWTIDRQSPRDFVGKAALAARPPRATLVGLVLQDGGGVLRAHQRVQTPSGTGEITSGTFSPTMQKSIALARVPAGVAVGDIVEVEVRDKLLAARVVKPPFVRNGRVLV